MLPRHDSDYRTLFWAFILFPSVPIAGYAWPAALPWLVPFALYASYSSGVLAHNQVHAPVFGAARVNALYESWLSAFYGCPLAFWIPTHVEHHHRHVNGPGDVTRTTRRSPEHDLPQALAYTLACPRWQRPLIADYVRRVRARGGPSWRGLLLQCTTLGAAHAGLLALGLALHGPALGALVYAGSFGLPAALAPSLMQLTNYLQHVHCDPESSDDHSRNFVGSLTSWLVFNAGYHTVHHERPSAHWSRYPELHRARAERIHPSLNQRTILGFVLDNYALGRWMPERRTRALDGAPGAALQRSSSETRGGRLLSNSAIEGGASGTGGRKSAKATP